MALRPWVSHLTLVVLLAVFLAIAATVAMSADSTSDESENLAEQLPRVRPLDPEQAMKSFVVAPGFRLEQVAAEPLVRDPVAMAFDANGRLFVVEMCDY